MYFNTSLGNEIVSIAKQSNITSEMVISYVHSCNNSQGFIRIMSQISQDSAVLGGTLWQKLFLVNNKIARTPENVMEFLKK